MLSLLSAAMAAIVAGAVTSPVRPGTFLMAPSNSNLMAGRLLYGDGSGTNFWPSGLVKTPYVTLRAEDMAFCAEAMYRRAADIYALKAFPVTDGYGTVTGYESRELDPSPVDLLCGSFRDARLNELRVMLAGLDTWGRPGDGVSTCYAQFLATDEERRPRMPEDGVFLIPDDGESRTYYDAVPMGMLQSMVDQLLAPRTMTDFRDFCVYPRLRDITSLYRYISDKIYVGVMDWAAFAETGTVVDVTARLPTSDYVPSRSSVYRGYIATTNYAASAVTNRSLFGLSGDSFGDAIGPPELRSRMYVREAMVHPVRISLTDLDDDPLFADADIKPSVNLFQLDSGYGMETRFIYMKKWWPWMWNSTSATDRNFIPMESTAKFFRTDARGDVDGDVEGGARLYMPCGAPGCPVQFARTWILFKWSFHGSYQSIKEDPDDVVSESSGAPSPTRYAIATFTEGAAERHGLGMAAWTDSYVLQDESIGYNRYGTWLRPVRVDTHLTSLADLVFRSIAFTNMFPEAWQRYRFQSGQLSLPTDPVTEVTSYRASCYDVADGYIVFAVRSASIDLDFRLAPLALLFEIDVGSSTDLPAFRELREKRAAGLPW